MASITMKATTVALFLLLSANSQARAQYLISESPPELLQNRLAGAIFRFSWKNSRKNDMCVVWTKNLTLQRWPDKAVVPRITEGFVLGGEVGANKIVGDAQGNLPVYLLPSGNSFRVDLKVSEKDYYFFGENPPSPEDKFFVRSALYPIECWRTIQNKVISRDDFASLTGNANSKVSSPVLTEPSAPFSFILSQK